MDGSDGGFTREAQIEAERCRSYELELAGICAAFSSAVWLSAEAVASAASVRVRTLFMITPHQAV
jgi:hypothetical protein